MSLLVLAIPAWAAAFNGGSFRATFPGPCATQQVKPGITKYYFHSKAENAIYGVAVFTGKEHRHLGELRTYLVKKGIKSLSGHREVHLGSVKGIEYSGIDTNGTPMTLRLYVTPANSYVVAASGFDMAKNREFVDSFQLAAPKAVPKKK